MVHWKQGLVGVLMISLLTACGSGESESDNQQKDSAKREQVDTTGQGTAEQPPIDLTKFGIDTGYSMPRGLEVGDEAPGFSALSEKEDTIALGSMLKEGPVLLFFYRGQWCPVCSRYLKQFEDSLELIRDAGASVVAVTPETPENVGKMRERSGTSVTILPDTSGHIQSKYRVAFRVTEAYTERIAQGLGADIAANNADSIARLPVPATYLIDQDGTIRWRHFDPDYKDRASVKEILRRL